MPTASRNPASRRSATPAKVAPRPSNAAKAVKAKKESAPASQSAPSKSTKKATAHASSPAIPSSGSVFSNSGSSNATPSDALPPGLDSSLASSEWAGHDIGLDLGSLPSDEVHDETDHAQWLQLRELASLQSLARTLNRPETHPNFDGKHCVDCDTEIPAKRLEMHRVRCVDCQSMLEEHRARGR